MHILFFATGCKLYKSGDQVFIAGEDERRGFLRSAKTAAVNKRDIIRMLCVLAYVAVGVCEVNKRQKEEKQKRIVFVVQQIYAPATEMRRQYPASMAPCAHGCKSK